MTKFYTHYSTIGKDVYMRYVDDQGKRCSDRIEFSPEYFAKVDPSKSNTDIKGIYGESLMRYESKDCSTFYTDYTKYKDVSGYSVYGSRNASQQYVANLYKGKPLETIADLDKIVCYNMDIETTTHNSVGFPSVNDPIEEVTLITINSSVHERRIVFHIEPIDGNHHLFEGLNCHFVECEDEVDLLCQFIRFWKRDYPDVLSGWNVSGFDIPFLVNRIVKILGEDAAKSLSPINRIRRYSSQNEKGRWEFNFSIQGVEIVDTMLLYKKIELAPRAGYSLDEISIEELKGATKLQHPSGIKGHNLYKEVDLTKINYNEDWGEWEYHKALCLKAIETNDPSDHIKAQKEFYNAYVLYNIIDVIRCREIELVKDLFGIAFFLAYFSKSNFSEVVSSMRFWQNLLYYFCLEEFSCVFAMSASAQTKDEKYEGAYVRPPIAGKYSGIGCVVTYDVASMYPNIIRYLNISPETLDQKKRYSLDIEDMLSGIFPEDGDDRPFSASGAIYNNDSQGILPNIVTKLFNRRKAEKKKMKQIGEEIAEIEKLLIEMEGIDR